MTENPDDHLEAHKIREREENRLVLLERIQRRESLELIESKKRLALIILSKN